MTEGKAETKRGTWVSWRDMGGNRPDVTTVRLHSSERDALRAAVKVSHRVVLVAPGQLLVDAIKAESGPEDQPEDATEAEYPAVAKARVRKAE